MDISEREGQGAVIPSDISEKENTLPTGGENQVNFPKKRKRHGKNKESYILTVRSRGEKILFAIVFVIFVVYAASLIYPFIWMFLSSLKTSTEYTLDGSQGRPFAFPDAFYFGNYSYAFTAMEYEGTNLFGCSLTAYGSLPSVCSAVGLPRLRSRMYCRVLSLWAGRRFMR